MTDDTPVEEVQVYRDAAGEWRWRAKAGNNEVVADSSEGYRDHQHAMSMAERIFPGKRIVVDGAAD